MGLSLNNLKPGMTIVYNGELFSVLECEHAKLGRGGAFCRVKLRNVHSNQIINTTLRDSDDVQEAFIEKRKLSFLYAEGDLYHFMDLETYEDLVLDKIAIEDKIIWLKDNLELDGIFYKNKLIDLELPITVDLKVIETEPGYRGDTVKAGTKPAKLETGLVINVPLFINTGDVIKIDTRTKEYIERVK